MRDGSLAVLALGGLGMLLYGQGRRWAPQPWLVTMLAVVVLWLGVGYMLSTDRENVFRKFAGFTGIGIAALGCARWLRPHDLVRTAWAAFGGYVAFCVFADVTSGAVPVNAEYRFSGTLHPNSQGIYCAIVCMASVCLARMERKGFLFKVTGIVAFICLLLTKSRGSLFALLVALLAMWIAGRERVTRVRAWATLACLLGVFALGVACIDVGTSRQFKEAMLLGRTEEAGSFSGRTPLWEELWKVYVPPRFWTGYGLGGFWTGERIEDLYESQEWAMGNAHNLYLDLLLQTGAIGLAIAVVTLCSLFVATESQLARTRNMGYQFYIGMFAFAACNATMESIFLHPTKFPTMMFLACTMSVAWFGPDMAPVREQYAGVWRKVAQPAAHVARVVVRRVRGTRVVGITAAVGRNAK